MTGFSTTPLVSILIPAHNAERWITDALKSALAQSWPRKEIIVVDDGSTDATASVARQFASKHVAVISQRNGGAAAARNRALQAAQGEYIQWLDADDLLDANKLDRQMKVARELANPRLLLSSAWGRFYYRRARTRRSPDLLWCDLTPAEWLTRKLEGNFYMIIESWLVSRKLTELAGPWDESLSADDDGEYFCRVIKAAEGIKFVGDALSFYRASGGESVSKVTLSKSKLESQFRSICVHIDTLLSLQDDERTRAACVSFLQRWLIHFYPTHSEITERSNAIASQLGGRLVQPSLPQKYDLIRKIFGWEVAKKAMFGLPSIRADFDRRCDGILSALNHEG